MSLNPKHSNLSGVTEEERGGALGKKKVGVCGLDTWELRGKGKKKGGKKFRAYQSEGVRGMNQNVRDTGLNGRGCVQTEEDINRGGRGCTGVEKRGT